MKTIDIINQLFSAIEIGDLAAIEMLYSEDAVQIEQPNRLAPNGARRDKAQILEAATKGKEILANQQLRIVRAIEGNNEVAVEAEWEGTLKTDIPALNLARGDVMKAAFAQFVTARDGKITRHITYDCFTPWEST